MGDDAQKNVEFTNMWGARLRLPCDMPDDILKDAIQTFHEELGALQAEGKSYDDEDAGNASVGRIKKKCDEKWSPYWHVVVGRSYGAFATHETRHFCSFKVDNFAVMMYKTA